MATKNHEEAIMARVGIHLGYLYLKRFKFILKLILTNGKLN